MDLSGSRSPGLAGHKVSTGAPFQSIDRCFEGKRSPLTLDLPDPDRLARRGEEGAIRAERDRMNPAGVALEAPQFAA